MAHIGTTKLQSTIFIIMRDRAEEAADGGDNQLFLLLSCVSSSSLNPDSSEAADFNGDARGDGNFHGAEKEGLR